MKYLICSFFLISSFLMPSAFAGSRDMTIATRIILKSVEVNCSYEGLLSEILDKRIKDVCPEGNDSFNAILDINSKLNAFGARYSKLEPFMRYTTFRSIRKNIIDNL